MSDDWRSYGNQDLAAFIAGLYDDDKRSYSQEFAELVRRVGREEAERLVDNA